MLRNCTSCFHTAQGGVHQPHPPMVGGVRECSFLNYASTWFHWTFLIFLQSDEYETISFYFPQYFSDCEGGQSMLMAIQVRLLRMVCRVFFSINAWFPSSYTIPLNQISSSWDRSLNISFNECL